MLKDILENKKCFKLVCGAGNEDVDEVEKLVAVYAKAGANYFDLSANKDVVDSARRGLKRVSDRVVIDQCYLNVSVGIKGDPHISKAFIDQRKCVGCGECITECSIQNAVRETGYMIGIRSGIRYIINNNKCIGCGHCEVRCPVKAITMNSETKPIQELLDSLPLKKLSSIELHVNSKNKEEIYTQWENLQKGYSGILSLCLDRSLMGDIELIEFIKYLIKDRKPYKTIIQADGCPMGGTDDKAGTTLQAIAIAQIVQKANLPVYLLLSGGTNSQTTALAERFGVKAHGVALGSYARLVVKHYIDQPDFWENKDIFNIAVEVAEELVTHSLYYMGDE